MSQILILLYWITGILHLAGVLMDNSTLSFITKPLLMPLLIGWYFLETKQRRTSSHLLIIIAFVFSCAGDVFLMPKTETFFLPGLVSFLITHLLYITSFRKEIKQTDGQLLLMKKPYVALPVVTLSALLISLVFNRIEPAMKIPVIVYAAVITLMVLMAMNREGKVSRISFHLTLTGALLFMLSDSLIAVNKFYQSFGSASFLIMLLYIAGQFLIAKGTAKTSIT